MPGRRTCWSNRSRWPSSCGATRAARSCPMPWTAPPNLPSCSERTVPVHGDFRLGNLMVGPDGLVGVFDWEFAHVGDPAEDLGWPCVRSWRFGRDDLDLGGVGRSEEFFAAYESASGTKVDRSAVRF